MEGLLRVVKCNNFINMHMYDKLKCEKTKYKYKGDIWHTREWNMIVDKELRENTATMKIGLKYHFYFNFSRNWLNSGHILDAF